MLWGWSYLTVMEGGWSGWGSTNRHDIQSQGSGFRGSKEREAHRKQVRERHSELWLMEGTQDTRPVGKGPVGLPVPGAESV